jgi:G3E family GTPase
MDLLREIKSLCETQSFDYLLIESTGIAEPMQVAETFEFDASTQAIADAENLSLSTYARLDTCVTVVDLSMMKRNIASIETIQSAFGEGVGEAEGEKHIGQLLIDQLEFANVIILNKCDIVSEDDLEMAKTFIMKINPTAKVLCSTFSQVNPNEILNTQLFSMEQARHAAGWLADMRNPELKQSESDEYGVISFIYTARKPFHPARLYSCLTKYFVLRDESIEGIQEIQEFQRQSDLRFKVMEDEVGWIARSKGFVWIATRGQTMTMWNQGGRLLDFTPAMDWLVESPESSWGVSDKDEIQKIKKNFVGKYGDKRQEIVFIGIGINTNEIMRSLDECLLTDEEFQMKESLWSRFYDPLPPWPIQPGMWSQILIPGTTTRLNIPDNVELEFNLITLESSNANTFCQVFLSNKFNENLVCTLRSVTCEQIHFNHRLHGSAVYELRVHSPNSNDLVHVFGYAGTLDLDEDAEADDDDDNMDH